MSKAIGNAYQDAKDALDFLESEAHLLEAEVLRLQDQCERQGTRIEELLVENADLRNPCDCGNCEPCRARLNRAYRAALDGKA